MQLRTPLTPISHNRRRGEELSPQHRAQIYGAARCGVAVGQIAKLESLSKSTVKKVIQRVNYNHTTTSVPRSGRPKKWSAYDERCIVRAARKQRKISYKELQRDLCLGLSKDTLYRILKANNLVNWQCKQRPFLTEEHARLRLAFARVNLERDWTNVVFSDECSIEQGKDKRREWCFRTPAEKWNKECVQTFSKSKGICIMVWGAIKAGERSELILMQRDEGARRRGYTSSSYCEALELGLLPMWSDDYVYMQDNAPIHKSAYTREWFEKTDIELLLNWPPYSPDLNPIEHLWFHLKHAVYDLNPQFESIQGDDNIRAELQRLLPLAWRSIRDDIVDNVVSSMRERLQAVIDAKGWHTRY